MKKYLTPFFIIISLLHDPVFAQQGNFIVEKAPFSSEAFDEFSPVYYKDGIVFCTNMNEGIGTKYVTSDDKSLFKINFVSNRGEMSWKDSKLFSKIITSKLNDGPVTFSRKGDEIYFSRNLIVEGKSKAMHSVRNKLGIFYSTLENGDWSSVKELRFNNEWYNITTPYLSPDGTRLYFASDKEGGFGGSDLYYCQWRRDFWDNPVNLGPVINTKGKESFPFINGAGELFFSSDGHPGIGGKDIFFSRFSDTSWITPVLLDAPINSTFDDFGFIMDSTMRKGYFTSDREGSMDIFKFRTDKMPLFYCEDQKINRYCFRFSDDAGIDIDPLILRYEWEFSGREKIAELAFDYCFQGPGDYQIKQNVVEIKTGQVVFNKASFRVKLSPVKQPYIDYRDTVIAGVAIQFDALSTYLPGYKIIDYNWDFGDNSKASGNTVTHVFKEIGEYPVKLGLLVKDSIGLNSLVCISRLIKATSAGEVGALRRIEEEESVLPYIQDYDNALIDTLFLSKKEFEADNVFQVELMSSMNKIDYQKTFKKIIPKYLVKEIIQTDSSYSYIIDEQNAFMDAYPAFSDAISNGFNETRIKTYRHSEPAEIELRTLKKVHSASMENFFVENTGTITFGGLAMLEQLSLFMKKYPQKKLLIAAHTDNKGPAAANLSLSQNRARTIADYIINKGIEGDRLIPSGYGSTKPIASNLSEAERKKNRRVEFVLMK